MEYKNPLKEKYSEDGTKLQKEYYDINKKFMEKLPIMKKEIYDEIKEKIQTNDIIIVESSTGSGKTVAVAPILQRIYDHKKKILLSQPRTVNIESITDVIRMQLGYTLGNQIGYQYSGGHIEAKNKKIHIVTDFFLIKFFDDNYDIIIVDEVHERKLTMDIFLAAIKLYYANTEDLIRKKTILLSATIDVEKFKKYFDSVASVATMKISGRTHPIKYIFRGLKSTMIPDIKSVIDELSDKPGDILVFLPTIKLIKQMASMDFGKDVFVSDLHSMTNSKIKNYIVNSMYKKDNYRKQIIFSSPIAETGLTIDGIKFVIETGVKNKVSVDQQGKKVAEVTMINKGSSKQRCGRAGRTAPGTCIMMYTKEDYENKFDDYPEPEIKNMRMHELLLNLLMFTKSVSKTKMYVNNLLDRVDENLVSIALADLYKLGLITGDLFNDKGQAVASMGLNIEFSTLILESFKYGLDDHIIAIVSSVLSAPRYTVLSYTDDKENIQMLSSEYGETISHWKMYKYLSDGFIKPYKKLIDKSHRTTNSIALYHNKLYKWCEKTNLILNMSKK